MQTLEYKTCWLNTSTPQDQEGGEAVAKKKKSRDAHYSNLGVGGVNWGGSRFAIHPKKFK